MSRQRRSRNAQESTRETREDRPGARSSQEPAAAESRSPTPSASEETSPEPEQATGGLAGEDKKAVEETSTKAAAIVKPASEPVREFAVCPRCHERRYKPEQAGTTVTCINCRASVVLG